jgi:hypothetical protein
MEDWCRNTNDLNTSFSGFLDRYTYHSKVIGPEKQQYHRDLPSPIITKKLSNIKSPCETLKI